MYEAYFCDYNILQEASVSFLDCLMLVLIKNSSFCQTSNISISHTFKGNKIVDLWDVVGATPVAAAPTTSSFSS